MAASMPAGRTTTNMLKVHQVGSMRQGTDSRRSTGRCATTSRVPRYGVPLAERDPGPADERARPIWSDNEHPRRRRSAAARRRVAPASPAVVATAPPPTVGPPPTDQTPGRGAPRARSIRSSSHVRYTYTWKGVVRIAVGKSLVVASSVISILVPSSRRSRSRPHPLQELLGELVGVQRPLHVSIAASLPFFGASPRFVSNSRLRSGSSLYAGGNSRATTVARGSSCSRSSRV